MYSPMSLKRGISYIKSGLGQQAMNQSKVRKQMNQLIPATRFKLISQLHFRRSVFGDLVFSWVLENMTFVDGCQRL
jgi:hypothetical protein